jgi:hypothetical protein
MPEATTMFSALTSAGFPEVAAHAMQKFPESMQRSVSDENTNIRLRLSFLSMTIETSLQKLLVAFCDIDQILALTFLFNLNFVKLSFANKSDRTIPSVTREMKWHLLQTP